MKYYQDITLIPDAETHIGFIWHKVFQQIHIALADNKLPDGSSAIAVSFPEYKKMGFPLGNRLRLFAPTEAQLKQLNADQWLSRLQDYCHIKPVRTVPEVLEYACFRRKAVKSPEKKVELLAKHLQKPVEEVMQFRKENKLLKACDLPYIPMESQQKTETGQKNRFRLFIEQTLLDKPVAGQFDCYGLSKTATVPWF